MSSKRKSYRNKKSINYADSNSNYESDDDFEKEFEPPSKKAKNKVVVVKDGRRHEKSGRKSPKQRLSIDEKLYQRDIETALKISISNSTSINEENVVTENAKTKISKEEDSDFDPQQETAAGYESEDNSCGDENENESDFSADELKVKTVTKKKKTNKTQCIENNKTKSATSNKQSSVEKEKEKQNVIAFETSKLHTNVISTNQNAMAKAKKPAATSRITAKPTPVINRSLSSLGLGGVVIKNPGPPIRVGLSRNMKVKPLHSKVSIPH